MPGLIEQQQIAAILTAYDDLIETNNQRIATLEAIAQQIYKEWFVRLRFPNWEHTPFHHGIPDGWEVKPLSNFCRLVMGQSPSSEFYNDSGNGLPFHQGVSFFNNRFPTHNIFCNTEGRIAEKGNILFSVRAPVGRINIATDKL
jgi:type I restriction enzyme S subunit